MRCAHRCGAKVRELKLPDKGTIVVDELVDDSGDVAWTAAGALPLDGEGRYRGHHPDRAAPRFLRHACRATVEAERARRAHANFARLSQSTTGPCGRCRTPIERYGPNASVLCPSCRIR
jgi:hypothetical protein